MCRCAGKEQEIGIDISFAVCDESGLPRVYRRYGEALVLSIALVPGKAYTAAVTHAGQKMLPPLPLRVASYGDPDE